MADPVNSTSVVTDWLVREEADLPDVAPGEEIERAIAPQTFVALRWIVVRDLTLIRLQVGEVDVPFELESTDGPDRIYRPKGLDDATLRERLVATGAAVAPHDTITLSPALTIFVLLRNEGEAPAKPRAALLIYEENT